MANKGDCILDKPLGKNDMDNNKATKSIEDGLIDKLANDLFWKMESLDPSGLSWDALSDRDRVFYRLCVEHLMRQPETTALFSPATIR